jgi:hypothetical protein
VSNWIDTHPGWLSLPDWASSVGEAREDSGRNVLAADPPPLWFGPAPAQQNEPPPLDAAEITAFGNRHDVAGRDARNKALGDAGEDRVLLHERSALHDAGRGDLARLVRWTAKEDGDGCGYDIHSFEPDGRDRLIEVKTTNGWNRTPFWITRNECSVAEERCDVWHLCRLWDFPRKPQAFVLRPPLDAHLALTPAAFLAQLR